MDIERERSSEMSVMVKRIVNIYGSLPDTLKKATEFILEQATLIYMILVKVLIDI